MPLAQNDYRWDVLGHSQTGASHVRQGLPNQDAINWHVESDCAPPTILAVADGHGSARSFRSDIGARLATDAAVEIAQEFFGRIRGDAPTAVKSAAEHIPPQIIRTWRDRVAEHLRQHPFTEVELERLSREVGSPARDRAAGGEQPLLAYGSTLLLAILGNHFLICFQLGDGDILAVDDATGEVRRVVPRDESHIANETTSLCQEPPPRYIPNGFQTFQNRPPGLVILATDGYANSFASPEAFLRVGTDYLEMLRVDGRAAVEQGLYEWLGEASRDGSGDDITLGIIYRCQPPLIKPTGQIVPPRRSTPQLAERVEQAGKEAIANHLDLASGAEPSVAESGHQSGE